MNRYPLIFIIFSTLVQSPVFAATEVTLTEAEIAFSLPEEWDTKGVFPPRTTSKMDSSNPLFVIWKRNTIADNIGKPVTPGINIAVFKVPPNADVVLASSALMHQRKWPFKAFLTSTKDGLVLPNSMGYLTEFSPYDGLIIKMFVIHSINNGKFIEITLSATDEIFPQIEQEFRAILKSFRLITNEKPRTPYPITFEKIEAIKPAGITLVSVIATHTGARIVALASANTHIARLMRQLESLGKSHANINTTLLSVKPVMVCGRRFNRAELEIDGDSLNLIPVDPASERSLRILDSDGKEFLCLFSDTR